MQSTLALSALIMGLAGGPHCVAMCGAACAGIAHTGPSKAALWAFQAGRLVGYAALGAVAALSMQTLGWLSSHSASLKPLATLFHVAALLLGLALLYRGRQPLWLQTLASTLWRQLRPLRPLGQDRLGHTAFVLGVLWALLPCGLLYSAVLLAALSNSMLSGAGVMLLFALGSGIFLLSSTYLLRRQASQPVGSVWPVRWAGLALTVFSLYALSDRLGYTTGVWCLT